MATYWQEPILSLGVVVCAFGDPATLLLISIEIDILMKKIEIKSQIVCWIFRSLSGRYAFIGSKISLSERMEFCEGTSNEWIMNFYWQNQFVNSIPDIMFSVHFYILI